MRFRNRTEAGHALARALAPFGDERPVVLAMPRGGVPVGCEVARALGATLEILVVRRIEVPGHPGRILGALAETGALVMDPETVRDLQLTPAQIDAIAAGEIPALARWVRRYRGGRPLPDVAGRCTIVVDEGISSGRSARVAARILRERQARRIVVAVPIASHDAVETVRAEVDALVFLESPEELITVGYWYGQARPGDDEALALLAGEHEREERAAATGPGLADHAPVRR
jgi:putative phosphoribosyl transferase